MVGPRVAELLGFPFLDRALPAEDSAAFRAAGEGASEEERTESLLTRLFARYSTVPDPVTAGLVGTPVDAPDEVVREQARQRLTEFATSDGVILGWGGTVVVAHAFHVRLDGPAPAREAQGAVVEGIRPDQARARRSETDKVRSAYLRRLYGKDWRDLSLYHLVLDSTALRLEDCSRLVADAARAFWER